MVRLPNNVLAAIGIGKPGLRLTKKELINALINAGYGPKKARAWVDTYIGTGQIYQVDEQPITGLELYTSMWWNDRTPTVTRVQGHRIKDIELTDVEYAIVKKTAPVARTEVLE